MVVTEERSGAEDHLVGVDCSKKGGFRDWDCIGGFSFQKSAPSSWQKEQQIRCREWLLEASLSAHPLYCFWEWFNAQYTFTPCCTEQWRILHLATSPWPLYPWRSFLLSLSGICCWTVFLVHHLDPCFEHFLPYVWGCFSPNCVLLYSPSVHSVSKWSLWQMWIFNLLTRVMHQSSG